MFDQITNLKLQPSDLVKQSLPFSYLALSAAATDGGSHSVRVYTDISTEWVYGDNALVANWTTTTEDILTHQVQLQNQSLYSEANDHAQCKFNLVFRERSDLLSPLLSDGSAFYSTLNVCHEPQSRMTITNPTALSQSADVTYQSGPDVDVHGQFIKNGHLPNTKDTDFRAIQDRWPVFGFAHDLGTVSGKGYAPEEPETQGWRGGWSTKAYQNFLTSKKCGGTRYFRHFWAILGHFCNW